MKELREILVSLERHLGTHEIADRLYDVLAGEADDIPWVEDDPEVCYARGVLYGYAMATEQTTLDLVDRIEALR